MMCTLLRNKSHPWSNRNKMWKMSWKKPGPRWVELEGLLFIGYSPSSNLVSCIGHFPCWWFLYTLKKRVCDLLKYMSLNWQIFTRHVDIRHKVFNPRNQCVNSYGFSFHVWSMNEICYRKNADLLKKIISLKQNNCGRSYKIRRWIWKCFKSAFILFNSYLDDNESSSRTRWKILSCSKT